MEWYEARALADALLAAVAALRAFVSELAAPHVLTTPPRQRFPSRAQSFEFVSLRWSCSLLLFSDASQPRPACISRRRAFPAANTKVSQKSDGSISARVLVQISSSLQSHYSATAYRKQFWEPSETLRTITTTYSILVYTGLQREHARLNHYLPSDIPSDTPARLLQCFCLRLWTSPESLRIHACLETSTAPPQRVSSSHLNLCTLTYRLSSLGLVRPMHVICPPHTLSGASHPQISRMQSCTNRPALHHWPAVPRAPRSSSLNLNLDLLLGIRALAMSMGVCICPWIHRAYSRLLVPLCLSVSLPAHTSHTPNLVSEVPALRHTPRPRAYARARGKLPSSTSTTVCFAESASVLRCPYLRTRVLACVPYIQCTCTPTPAIQFSLNCSSARTLASTGHRLTLHPVPCLTLYPVPRIVSFPCSLLPALSVSRSWISRSSASSRAWR